MRGRIRTSSDADPAHSDAATVDLVRQARKLRHRFRSRPADMHKHLSRLATRRPTDLTATRISAAVTSSTISPRRPDVSEATQAFTVFVKHELIKTSSATPLRYSKRLELLRTGESHGLSRFQANLVIAAVQHELGRLLPPTPERVSGITLFLVTQLSLVALIMLFCLIAGW